MKENAMSDDIPSLTLRVLQNIQGELVGLRGDVQDMKGDIHEMKGDIHEMKGDIHEMKGDIRTLNGRVDNFLSFIGRDVQDLKLRVAALEADRKRS
jgi:peptidoglycan hydrolase CwlO-like protein